jgi:arginase
MVVWLDAHGDFNTPAITISGYLGGMAVAMLAGRAPELFAGPLGLRPVPERNRHSDACHHPLTLRTLRP